MNVIQNRAKMIYISETNITNCLSQSGLISLNFAKININSTRFESNYAQIDTNGISMISSDAYIGHSLIENFYNDLNLTATLILNQPIGFINMNFESTLRMEKTNISGLTGTLATFMFLTG